MVDTQWPRYMVFQKMDENKRFVHNGTVHAPDMEIALLNGRDVFGRRPFAVAMYVVGADVIFSKTVEEIEAGWGEDVKVVDESGGTYLVYGKLNHQSQCEQLGEVEAATDLQAMKKANRTFTDERVWMWWVFPKAAVLSSKIEDVESMFKPVEEHTFKNHANYPVITMMRQIKSKGKLED